MTETVLAYRKPGADQAEAEKVAKAPADALAGRLVSDGFWTDRERGSYAYAFPDDVTYQQGKQSPLAALDQAAPADKSNKLGWLRWLEIQDLTPPPWSGSAKTESRPLQRAQRSTIR